MITMNTAREDLELSKILLKEYQAQAVDTPCRKENIEICEKNIATCEKEVQKLYKGSGVLGNEVTI